MENVQDVIKLRGCIDVYLHDAATGEVVQHEHRENTVVTTGRAWVLKRICASSTDTNVLGWIGIGTSSASAPLTSDTGLSSEVGTSRKSVGTWDFTGTTATAAPYMQGQISYATNEGNTTISEAGFFNNTTTGAGGGATMLSHVTFTAINKTTSNTLTISYTISN